MKFHWEIIIDSDTVEMQLNAGYTFIIPFITDDNIVCFAWLADQYIDFGALGVRQKKEVKISE